MRIITGKAKGIVLKAPQGETTRPTADRVKEAVFSMLQFDIEDRSVLDLFAGSGQMGLEALSRGAAEAVFIDKSKDAIKAIKENLEKTKLLDEAKVYQNDYLDYIKHNKGQKFDIIIIDPPYAHGKYQPSLKALIDADMLKPTTFIICESGTDEIFDGDKYLEESFSVAKQTKYSKTFITILQPKEME